MATQSKILVVDDDRLTRKYLETVLSSDGHRVVAAENGEQALEEAAKQTFDLALIDLRMPGIDGMQVLKTLRQRSPDTPLIVLTAHASLQTAVEALREGAHDYLFKPCRMAALRESVRTGLLKRRERIRQRRLLAQAQIGPDSAPADRSAEQARFLQRGSLIFDFMRHVVTLDGHLLELSPTEFDLLAYLASEAPRVVPSAELAREVQGYEVAAEESQDTVRYHIYRVRQKIRSATGRQDVIRTVRGVGYALEPTHPPRS